MSLEAYQEKRDFKKTPEPRGRKQPAKKTAAEFVIQKHQARNLHYDLRLEVDGVMKSWAVPKGPSLNPDKKSLAIQVEDHPVEYNSFEGTIPEGSYGAGSVIVWDRGTWQPEGDPEAALKRGKISFELQGEKLSGAWTLIRLRKNGDGKQWLLMKKQDQAARPNNGYDILEEAPESVLSGRSLEELAGKKKKNVTEEKSANRRPKAGDTQPMPENVRPQLATLVDTAPDGDSWLHEIKYDGYRILAFIRKGQVILRTRNGHDWTGKLSDIAEALQPIADNDYVLDGELVAMNEEGRPDFQVLQNSMQSSSGVRRILYAFDILYAHGRSLTSLPLLERKQELRTACDACDDNVQFSEHIIGDGDAVFESACEAGYEGIISKKTAASYQQRRTRSWLKVKCQQQQEFVIGGYTTPSGSRKILGALLLGYFTSDGQLRYCGKVGTGFSEKTLSMLGEALRPLESSSSPFSPQGLQPETSGVTWVTPQTMCEVTFHQWTADGALRHPVFKGLRYDKKPEQTRREEPITRATAGPDAPSPVQLTSPDKVLFPAAELTKQDLYAYYGDIAPHMLPYIKDRPLSLIRCPDGKTGECFYQKHPPKGLSKYLHTIQDTSGSYLYLDEVDGLLSLAQMGAIEIHPWNCTVADLEHPDQLVLDLDPDDTVPWSDVIALARTLREIISTLELPGFVRTSGGKGLHIVVPIQPNCSWQLAKSFSKAIGSFAVRLNPDGCTITSSRQKRKGKIYIDYLRNSKGATAVANYSWRAREGAPVATPLRWDELGRVSSSTRYTRSSIKRRLGALKNDPWQSFGRQRASITNDLLETLQQL